MTTGYHGSPSHKSETGPQAPAPWRRNNAQAPGPKALGRPSLTHEEERMSEEEVAAAEEAAVEPDAMLEVKDAEVMAEEVVAETL